MQNMSRKAKYEQLRQQLQNDAETQISTKGLSAYAERLSRLDSAATEHMEVQEEENHDPIHARRESYFIDEPTTKGEEKETSSHEEKDVSFNNEYLDEYINEVKDYNKKRGLLSSDNTQINILKQLQENKGIRPFDDQRVAQATSNMSDEFLTTEIPIFARNEEEDRLRNTIALEVKQLLDQEVQPEVNVFEKPKPDYEQIVPVVKIEELDDEEEEDEEEEETSSKKHGFRSFFSRNHQEEEEDEEDEEDEEEEESQGKRSLFGNLRKHLNEEKELREKLMNETVQLRVQMDEYEDELNDMNDSVSHTNRLLNFILVLLILALLVVLGVVIYWIMLQKGII